jgi:hypothetical protein
MTDELRDWCDPGTGIRDWHDGAEGRERYFMRETEVARFLGALVVYLASATIKRWSCGLGKKLRRMSLLIIRIKTYTKEMINTSNPSC